MLWLVSWLELIKTTSFHNLERQARHFWKRQPSMPPYTVQVCSTGSTNKRPGRPRNQAAKGAWPGNSRCIKHDTMVRLEMERELYKKAAKTATTMFGTNYLKVFQFGTKNFKYDEYGNWRIASISAYPFISPGQFTKSSAEAAKSKRRSATRYVWRTLIQTLNFSQPMSLADNDYRKVWANPPYGAMLKLLSEKVVYDWCSDAVEQKKPVVQRVFAVFDALRAIAVQVVSHYNFLQQVLRSQQAEITDTKVWTVSRKNAWLLLQCREWSVLFVTVAQNVTVMQRILSFWHNRIDYDNDEEALQFFGIGIKNYLIESNAFISLTFVAQGLLLFWEVVQLGG